MKSFPCRISPAMQMISSRGLHVFAFNLEAHNQKNGCPSRSTCLPSALTVRASRRVASSDLAERGVVIFVCVLGGWKKGERCWMAASLRPPHLVNYPLRVGSHFRDSSFLRLASQQQQRPKWIGRKIRRSRQGGPLAVDARSAVPISLGRTRWLPLEETRADMHSTS